MAKFLFHVGRWSYLHKWIVIGVWIAAVVGIGATSLFVQRGFNDVFQMNDVPSTRATQLLEEKFPGTANPATSSQVDVVFQAPEGRRLDDPDAMAAMDRTVDAIRTGVEKMGDSQRLQNPVRLNAALRERVIQEETSQGLPRATAEKDADTLATLSPDGRYGVASFSFGVDLPAHVTAQDKEAVARAADIARAAGLRVEIAGPGYGDTVKIEPISETVGLIVALVILALTFGSLVAAGLPLVTAVVGIAVGTLLTVAATAFGPLNSMTPTLGLMLGLAVGIDYALFIMSRYRDELREGLSRPDAIGLATGTAGSAVVFAGLTVVIALAGLRLADIPFLSYMGYAAAANVVIAVLVALTLLPALLGVFGRRVFRRDRAVTEVPQAGTAVPAGPALRGGRESLGTRWVKLVHRVPGLMVALVMAGLAALTVPALHLQLALPSDTTANVASTQRQASDLLAEGFGPGRNAPFLVLVDAEHVDPSSPTLAGYMQLQGGPSEETARRSSFQYVVAQMNANVDVRNAQIVGVSPDQTTAQILVTPKSGPRDEETTQLLQELRRQQAEIQDATGVEMGITGLAPIQQDITERLEGALPGYLALVVGLALVLLLMVFRSLAVTVMAALGFLLSVGAAFGVTVLVWQDGLWGLWDSPGPLISFMPIFLIGVTFGLAMDYQVFIVSRMRERYVRHSLREDTGVYTPVEDSVIGGFGVGARVVTAAALIMIGVFASFIFQPLPFIQIFGFALGAGVLFDAFFIRMTAVPALMFLFGRATWYIPTWLDRLLPTIDVEGTALEEAFANGEIRRAGE